MTTSSSIDVNAIRERVAGRAYAWTRLTGAPGPVIAAAAAHTQAVAALDDALVAFEVEVTKRRTALKAHNEAVTAALREGKNPPAAKVPSLEEIEVRHGAILAAHETFVHEAASYADRTAREHYPAWRAAAVQSLQEAADRAAAALTGAADAVAAWASLRGLVGGLDRTFAPRAATMDDANAVRLVEAWEYNASVAATDIASIVNRKAMRLRELTDEPVVVEWTPEGGPEQYSRAYLAQQSPSTRAQLLERAAAANAGQAQPEPNNQLPETGQLEKSVDPAGFMAL
jgi:hypothetical protein